MGAYTKGCQMIYIGVMRPKAFFINVIKITRLLIRDKMTEATERATYYERNRDKVLEQHKKYYEENKDKILEKQKRANMCVPGRLVIHEELLKKDRERLKTTFIQEQIEELNLNSNKINKDRR